ncbi:putative pectinesterase inhibitor domain-containing protein [Rosa chinensis]|uniref:Putative pectinesterase inhibitor domain-containing protein n=1 Tax=Rosa chinensis TaxID=74649 RepID=A0A2P6PWV2_ROSCH|nr:putative invertase inhibitor [Rosa chinensis]PRQ26410.1 putative pectinesterase inhibitor domain-containing protein [Rosa chinensis]
MKPITSFFFLSTLCVLQHVALVANSQPGKPVGGQPGKSVGGQPGGTSGPVSGNQIEEACKYATNKDLCITNLKKDPNSQGADLVGLALIAIRLAAANAADVESHLRTLMINNATSLAPEVQQGVSDCIEHYTDANEQLDDSVAAVSAKEFHDVEMWVKVAIGDAAYCQNAMKGQHTVVEQKNKLFTQMCENVLAVIKAVTQKG